MISATGRIPVMAAPIATPRMACSEIGVSQIRSWPNSASSPAVVLNTPPAAVTESAGTPSASSRDPLDIARARLEALGVPAESVTAADERAARTVEEAVAAARAAPGPDPGAALTDVWADGGSSWRT